MPNQKLNDNQLEMLGNSATEDWNLWTVSNSKDSIISLCISIF